MENWGHEGMDKEKFLTITREKFNKMLVARGLPCELEYNNWESFAPRAPQRRRA
jgi:hypothetical protein